MGSGIGAYMSRARRMAIPLTIAFVPGMLITVAEPNLTVLTQQMPSIPNQVLIFTVAAGAGMFLVIALLRTILHIPLSRLLVGLYLIVFVLAIVFVPNDFLPVSFDSGGVTTEPITVPFIIALGVGMASVRSDKDSRQLWPGAPGGQDAACNHPAAGHMIGRVRKRLAALSSLLAAFIGMKTRVERTGEEPMEDQQKSSMILVSANQGRTDIAMETVRKAGPGEAPSSGTAGLGMSASHRRLALPPLRRRKN